MLIIIGGVFTCGWGHTKSSALMIRLKDDSDVDVVTAGERRFAAATGNALSPIVW